MTLQAPLKLPEPNPLALFEITTFTALANVLLAARKLATDPDPLNQMKALADLAKDGKALTAALKGAGLSPLAAQMASRAKELDRFLTHEGPAKDGARLIFWQVAPFAVADPRHLTAPALDPEAATEAMVAAILASELARDFRTQTYAEDYFRKVMSGTLVVMLASKDFIDSITPALWRQTLADEGIVIETVGRIDETTQRTEQKIDAQADRLARIEAMLVDRIQPEAQGVPNATIFALVHRLAPSVTDIEVAVNQLRRAVEIAADTIARGESGSNLDAFVDDVLRRVGTLTTEGRLDEAADLALAKLAEARAGVAQIRNAAINALLLNEDATGAATLIAERVDEDTPDPAGRFYALRAERDVWYARGRDRGLRLDLEVAIALARIAYNHATNADERGAALTDLGIALATLGEREPEPVRLEEAAAAQRAALQQLTRGRVPLAWGLTQMNLGNALLALGAREIGTARLEEAVEAYRAALRELTRDRASREWAGTQNNLGNALRTLGESDPGNPRLAEFAEAVDAHRAALSEFTRDRAPLDWAMTQNNLGNALLALGGRELGTQRLEDAVGAYRAALEERTRDHVPEYWAMTQNNLGNALRALGSRQAGTARLEEGLNAFRAALEVRTRDRLPLGWAMTRGNMAILHVMFFDKTGQPAELEHAQAALDDALDVYNEAGASQYVAMASSVQALIDARRVR